MTSTFINTHYLEPLLSYLMRHGHLSQSMRFEIRAVHSAKADEHHRKNRRSFCHVILGERAIRYASSIKALPETFIVGILLHEIVHMIIENEKGDPELGVDQWIIDNIPEARYDYKNVRYIDFDGQARVAHNLECVADKFLSRIEA